MYVKMFHLPFPFVALGEKKRSLGRDYHPLCLKCQKCMRTLTAGQHAEVNKLAFQYKSRDRTTWMDGCGCNKYCLYVAARWEAVLFPLLPEDVLFQRYCQFKRTDLHARPAGSPHLSVWLSLDRYLVTGVSPAAQARIPSATLTSAMMKKCRKTKDTPRPETIRWLIK